jgi:hypothetical protein
LNGPFTDGHIAVFVALALVDEDQATIKLGPLQETDKIAP